VDEAPPLPEVVRAYMRFDKTPRTSQESVYCRSLPSYSIAPASATVMFTHVESLSGAVFAAAVQAFRWRTAVAREVPIPVLPVARVCHRIFPAPSANMILFEGFDSAVIIDHRMTLSLPVVMPESKITSESIVALSHICIFLLPVLRPMSDHCQIAIFLNHVQTTFADHLCRE
jgi:hypothetical protein